MFGTDLSFWDVAGVAIFVGLVLAVIFHGKIKKAFQNWNDLRMAENKPPILVGEKFKTIRNWFKSLPFGNIATLIGVMTMLLSLILIATSKVSLWMSITTFVLGFFIAARGVIIPRLKNLDWLRNVFKKKDLQSQASGGSPPSPPGTSPPQAAQSQPGGNSGNGPKKPQKKGFSSKTKAFMSLGVVIAIYCVLLGLTIAQGWWFFLPFFAVAPVALGFLLLTFFTTAKHNTWFASVNEGTMKGIVAGLFTKPGEGSYVTFIPNVTGYYYDKTDHKVKEALNGEDDVNWFTELTGLYFVSWAFPFHHVYTFPILKTRFKKNHTLIEKMEERIQIDDRPTNVDHLIWKIERPFYLHEVDLLGDNSRIDVIGFTISRVWDPYQMLFTLRGNFFGPYDRIVNGYIISKLKPLAFADLALATSDLNPLDLWDYRAPGQQQFKAFDVATTVGLIPETIIIEEFSLSESAKAIQAALEQQKIAEAEGLAVVAATEARAKAAIEQSRADYQVKIRAARGDARVLEITADAQRTEVGQFLAGAIEGGVSGNQAAAIYLAKVKYPHLTNLRMLADGNSNNPLLFTDSPDSDRVPVHAGAPEPMIATTATVSTPPSAQQQTQRSPLPRKDWKGGKRTP